MSQNARRAPERALAWGLLGCTLALGACGSSAAVPVSGADGSSQDGSGQAVGFVEAGTELDADGCLGDGAPECPASDAGEADATRADAGRSDASTDAADGAVCGPSSPPPSAIASTGNVTFVLTNTSSADRFVVTQAFGCDAFSIGGVTLSLPFTCPCECTAPRPTFLVERVAPGATLTMVWDGRAPVSFVQYEDCTMFGAPGRCGSAVTGALQPVVPGSFTATFDYLVQAPQGIGASACSSSGQGYSCQGLPTFGAGTRCAVEDPIGAQQATATFVLPPSGDLSVPVSIP